MTKSELISNLQGHFSTPQPSERWAMYRLIAPIVDYANLDRGLTPYYEFNQTSNHGNHQSVDIALLGENLSPRVLIEAKRLDRRLTPEQIEKYLDGGVRGVVSNGELWVLCNGQSHVCISVLNGGAIDEEALDQVVAFIREENTSGLEFTTTPNVYRAVTKPKVVVKGEKAVRTVHIISDISGTNEFSSLVDTLDSSPYLERVFLEGIAAGFPSNESAESLKIEARKTRISFFQRLKEGKGQRLARIELGKQNPDVLVLTDIVANQPALSSLSQPTIHDKGAHMRRFRLSDEDEARKFGLALAQALTSWTVEVA